MGGQLHFYMETQAALAVPKDGEEMEIYGSVQGPAIVQVRPTQGTPFKLYL